MNEPEAAACEISAEVISLSFRNPENNYSVVRLKLEDDESLCTAVGCLPQVTPGEQLRLKGEWVVHPRFGRQFQISWFEQSMPASLNGIKRYLASGSIKGVGEVMAGRMIKKYGERVLEILDNSPDDLLKVPGLGKKKLATIVSSWDEQREVRGLMLFLQTHEVPTTFAGRIFKQYGAGSIERLTQNPYDLAYDIKGVGFKSADRMALKLGFSEDDPRRLEAALVYGLFSLSEQGHLFFPRDELLVKVSQMLCGIGLTDLDEALSSLEGKKRVRIEPLPEQNQPAAVYLSHFYRYERETAERLHALATHPSAVSREKAAKILPGLERAADLSLSPEQREAVLSACESKVFILTGGPGTGKTTITKMVVQALSSLGLKVKLAAPTGRAAKRLSEATGYPAATLHRLLGYSAGGAFEVNEENKLKCDVLLVDEASMLDALLGVHMLRALPLTCRLVLVGDVNQLPSVGPGNLLSDLIQSEVVESARLTHIFRQALESMIVVNAHRVNQGEFPHSSQKPPPQADFFWVECDDPRLARDKIIDLVCERVPRTYGFDPLREIQVLTPMHKGEAGTLALNIALRERLNPRGQEIVRGNAVFRVGDRVLQTRNNYEKEVFNGDLGWITGLQGTDGEVEVEFDGRKTIYAPQELDELNLAYAISVHKSQGSEYPAVIVPVLTQHFIMLRRNLIYTALTRARKLAILIGSRKAMAIGLNNLGAEKRYTHLRYRLAFAFNQAGPLLD